MLLCYDYHNGITYEEDNIIFTTSRARIVLYKNNQFTWNNSICENHKCGDHGYRCED